MTERSDRATAPSSSSVLFDADFYLKSYGDVRRAGIDPFEHYMGWGQREGRAASAALAPIARAVQLRSEYSSTPLDDIIAAFPEAVHEQLGEALPWDRLRVAIQPPFYSAQLEEPHVLNVQEVFDHFLSRGVFDGLRVTCLFQHRWYLDQLQRSGSGPLGADVSPFLHWLSIGWNARIVPTPLFDEEYYLDRHSDLRKWRQWAFQHYFEHGCYEPGRRPSAVVPSAKEVTAAGRRKEERRPTLLEAIAPAGADAVYLRRSSRLEDFAFYVSEKMERLRSGERQELVDKAAQIEPLVLRPYGPREVSIPPVRHPFRDIADAGEALRANLPDAHFDVVLLAPHCRMAGSARVAGAVTRALDSIQPDASILVLTTELPDFERPDWFSSRLTVVDLSQTVQKLGPHEKVRVLLDVIRGLSPTQVINVNSRLGWNLFNTYGRQLATWARLTTYLFTWDLDQRGNKGGYPVEYLHQCFGTLSAVIVDNAPLRRELVYRYALSSELQKRLHVAYTPVGDRVSDYAATFARRRQEGRKLRAVWAGRFDRQKRFDVVVEVAHQLPELEIWAWGKPVLGGLDVDMNALPPNIKLQGTYEEFDDLPFEAADFFLYTSEWDGLPTVLLDAGARGIATIASSVGGVGDVLCEKTGFPVRETLDPDAYVRAVKQMRADPLDVTRRAQAFKERVRVLCAEEAYCATLARALGVDPGQQARGATAAGRHKSPDASRSRP